MAEPSRSAALLSALLIATLACGGSSSPTEPGANLGTVTFEYRSATAINPQVAAAFPGCVGGVGNTHIHPGWRGFVRIDLGAQGAALWTITFQDVPIGSEQRIRVSDANTCSSVNPTGASTANVFANGAQLVRVVDTPGSGAGGVEPGLAFTLRGDGTVAP